MSPRVDGITSGAVLSPDGVYRYRLWRDNLLGGMVGAGGLLPLRVTWIMLNPSVANAELDDPTIRKCIGFSRRWGYSRLDVVNLFAYRHTDSATLGIKASKDDPRPQDLLEHLAGPDNYLHIAEAVRYSVKIICAWGAHPLAKARHVRVLQLLQRMHRLRDTYALRLTQAGAPAHPLYVPYDVPLVPMAEAESA
jgi:hypothetical protein